MNLQPLLIYRRVRTLFLFASLISFPLLLERSATKSLRGLKGCTQACCHYAPFFAKQDSCRHRITDVDIRWRASLPLVSVSQSHSPRETRYYY